MSYRLDSALLQMMPTHFGAHCGPRQTPDGGRYINDPPQEQTRYAVSFLSCTRQLNALLPEGFEAEGEPVVTVEMAMLRNIPWLAGRGYNILGVRFPAAHRGKAGRTAGLFVPVLWENRAEPIITGREQLGFNKIFADIDDVAQDGDQARCRASWDGFEFVSMLLQGLVKAPEALVRAQLSTRPGEGLLHFKYIPATGGGWTGADAAYATLSPWDWRGDADNTPDDPPPEVWIGGGEVTFHRALWEQMPTQHRIVNALADLDIVEPRGATMMRLFDRNDHRAQVRL